MSHPSDETSRRRRKRERVAHRIDPNTVTLARIGLIPVFVAFLLTRISDHATWIAFVVFALMAASDGLDGWVARTRGRVTTLGVFLDPIADKMLITAALVSLVQLREIDAWVVIIILSREFAVTGLRVLAATRGDVLPAQRLGKLKTASQIAMVLALIPKDSPALLGTCLIWVAVVLTVVSGAEYFWSGRHWLREVRDTPIPL